jgi:hypothetical protein
MSRNGYENWIDAWEKKMYAYDMELKPYQIIKRILKLVSSMELMKKV